MSAIEHLLRQPAAQVLGWALLHFVWQGALIGGFTALALAGLRRSAADVRYVVSTIGLSLMLTLPAVTAVQLWRTAPSGVEFSSATMPIPATAFAPPIRVEDMPARPVPGTSEGTARATDGSRSIRIEPWLPMLVFAWVSGVILLSLRLMSGWLWVQRMKSHGASPAAAAWEHLGARLSRRLHIVRHVRLLESTMVDVPTVIGWMKPVILLPASALSGLTPHQLEAILAHELAHVRRHDYLVNLLQTLVETLLFYHPAVWWLSRRIRSERENCCDDLAVSLCGDPYTYAKALADLEELRGAGRHLVMAASGGSLVHRVRRLLGAPTHAGRAPGWLAGGVSVLVMLGIAAGAVGTDAFQSAQPRAATRASTVPASSAVRDAGSQAQQLADEARATTAAAKGLKRSARLLSEAAKAATWIQDVSGQATTPFIAGQTLRARASALERAAAKMAARADAQRAALAADGHVFRAERAQAVAGADRSSGDVDETRSAIEAARASTTQALASAAATVAPRRDQHSRMTMSWSNNGERMEVRVDGEIEFTDDDRDVKRLSPGGSLRIKEGGVFGGFFASHTVEFTADASGNITRRFWAGMSEQPFDPEGRQWLAKYLPRFIRQTAFGARARVARILKAHGPAGVLAEISLIEGSWGKKAYFVELLNAVPLDAATVKQVLAQAGREIESDFELATLLIERADKLLADESTRQAYFEAAGTIQSDFEMARVFKAALKRGPVSPPVLAAILEASRNIDSDFEQASVLLEVANRQSLDSTTRAPFFSALGTVDSDFEQGRVLKALSERSELDPETTVAMLASGATVQSDFEAASFLRQIAKQQPIEGTLRVPFFRAVDSIGSTFERGRVLQAVAGRPDVSAETVLAVLRATAGMKGSFEASQVLLAVAAAHPVDGAAREAYIDVAEQLGDFEQGRALAALVRNERRK
jgi:beta-lactamase regulating signal transducer with metallopeptidase domain